MRRDPNAWRRNLDQRDPDYLDEPTDEESDAQAEIEEWAAECELLECAEENGYSEYRV